MPTQRQKKVAKLLVGNTILDKPLNGAQIVESSGYGVSMRKNPQVVLESDGVKEELIETYGFDPEIAKQVVGQILVNGENDTVKLNAADKIFKVHGSYAAEKRVNINLDGELTEREQELTRKLLQGQRD